MPRVVVALAWAVALVVALNALVGLRLAPLLGDASPSVRQLLDLEARVAAFPAPGEVRVLVFGNSHAQHMLRPPTLAPALGLAPDQAFNLALPGATTFETGLVARRLAPRFPAARLAIVGVDASLLSMDPRLNDARVRVQTRFDPAARWRWAGYLPDGEERLGALAWMPAPLGDFAADLRVGLRDPRQVARALAWGDRGRAARPFAPAYRWGHPPADEVPRTAAQAAKRRQFVSDHPWLIHVGKLFFGAPAIRAAALEDLEATCRALEAQGMRVVLVEAPYAAPLRRYLARAHAADLRAHDAAVAGYLAASGRALVAAPDLPEAAFDDCDHLAAAGAGAYAAAIAPRLGASPRPPASGTIGR